MTTRSATLPRFAAMVTVAGINLLFVAKYAPPAGIDATTACGLYLLVFVSAALCYARGLLDGVLSELSSYTVAVVVAAVLLTLIMRQFDPATIHSTRYPAINAWIGDLLEGRFPYGTPTRPSGFPMLYVVAFPFYLLGDVGLLQIAGFLMFAVILRRRNASTAPGVLLLLLLSPAFQYEIVTRSELFTNMVLVVALWQLLSDWLPTASIRRSLALGALAGLILSTRSVILLAYVVFLAVLAKANRRNTLTAAVSMTVVFAVTLVPFVIWDADRFLAIGPFAVQMVRLHPMWIRVFLVVAGIGGFLLKRPASVALTVGVLLTVSVAVAHLTTVWSTGWSDALWRDQFDISYYCLALPFLVAAAGRQRED